jgi:hypothetical protein
VTAACGIGAPLGGAGAAISADSAPRELAATPPHAVAIDVNARVNTVQAV